MYRCYLLWLKSYRLTAVALLWLLLCVSPISSALAQHDVPQFSHYLVRERYTGRNAAPILRTHDDRLFRTTLRRAAREKPNFAGHYIVSTWGCGAGCVMGAVIDAQKGNVYWLPHTVCCWSGQINDSFEPVEYRRDSRLLVLVGARDEKEGDEGKHYYKFVEGQFQLLRSIHKKVP